MTTVVVLVTVTMYAPDGMPVPAMPQPVWVVDDMPLRPETVVEELVVVAPVNDVAKVAKRSAYVVLLTADPSALSQPVG
jgi:hypothetical protein